ncbi:MAG: SGNH/GDSL hydrolase family protein [Proteobacteria bacterium]|nr:hypothetical protein [Methylibium sp.]MCH8856094.1 SGNH/GDSL hydrolase family protein [Pseudomonadota bacterium]
MIAKLLLGPVLLWQGRRVRATALRLPEAAGPRAQPSGTLRVLIVGDSSAAGVGAAHQQEALAGRLTEALARLTGQSVGWQLVARSGHRSEQALAALDSTELEPADVLVTALGVNDVVDQVPPARALAALQGIDGLARERAGVRLSIHCAAPPMQHFPVLPQPLRWFFGRQAARFNAALTAQVSGEPSRHVLQLPAALQRDAAALMAADGFHPGPRGYALWAEALAAQVVIGLGLPARSMAT